MSTGKMILGDGRPDGVTVGASATELVSFYGVTPVAQQTAPAAATSAVTTTDFNLMRTALINIGVWKAA